jgi:hypothetical protein
MRCETSALAAKVTIRNLCRIATDGVTRPVFPAGKAAIDLSLYKPTAVLMYAGGGNVPLPGVPFSLSSLVSKCINYNVNS